MSKKKTEFSLSEILKNCARKIRSNAEILILVTAGFFVLFLGTCVSFIEDSGIGTIDLNDFQVGTVADRDITLMRDLSFVDEEATEIRRNAQLNLVTAVFRYLSADNAFLSEAVSVSAAQTQFFEFLRAVDELRLDSSDAVTNSFEVQELYPGAVSADLLEMFFALEPDVQSELLQFTSSFFNVVMSRGFTSFPDEGMERFSQTEVEVVRGNERSTVPKSSLLTKENLSAFLDSEMLSAGLDDRWEGLILAFISPFLRENLVYQSEDSEKKIQIVLNTVTPVMTIVPQGEKIIRRGFVITEESYRLLEYLNRTDLKINFTRFFATVLILFLSMLLSVFILSVLPCKETAFRRNRIFLLVCFVLMYALSLVFSHIHALQKPLNFMLAVPLGFFSMLIAVLIQRVVAVAMVFSLSAAVFCASGFLPEPTLFAVFSGLAAVAVVRDTGKRMDLVYSAALLSVLYAAISFIITIVYPASLPGRTFYVLSAAVNGFLSGMLVISFLPLMENVLNSVTSFRLMELSDLNTPLMQKMLHTVPGTYSHSQMVASLAENACRAIGANSLLARVGAYYHDIGKMEQGEYFVENQQGENKHTTIAPRLSATVIRSHVKQGVEKARNLKLPQEVIDIIEEHHGNSVISFFYNRAKDENPDTDPEDFTYPGNPPRSKESAVVMLADTVEAATRTLKNPSPSRLEKFIDDLVNAKIEHGQLKNCDLTFHDLGVIKETFRTILAGHYHNRIEYPDQKDPDAPKPSAGSDAEVGKDKLGETVREIADEIQKMNAAQDEKTRSAGKEAPQEDRTGEKSVAAGEARSAESGASAASGAAEKSGGKKTEASAEKPAASRAKTKRKRESAASSREKKVSVMRAASARRTISAEDEDGKS